MQKTPTRRLVDLFVISAYLGVIAYFVAPSLERSVKDITHLYNSQSFTRFLINRVEQQEELRRQGRLPRPEPDTHGFLNFRA